MKSISELAQKVFQSDQEIKRLREQLDKIDRQLLEARDNLKLHEKAIIEEAKRINSNNSPEGKVVYVEDGAGSLWTLTIAGAVVRIDKCETVIRMEKPQAIAVKADR